ncbi:NfeD family protein [Sphingomicrobium flavum]|uniref:NfeD family protein n=1 Tax=Sphingomicrobium flavum TaxID=1229164 RepID=UPI0021ADBEFF|nr:NfeD family protein [Sphingomicrobium flavum]
MGEIDPGIAWVVFGVLLLAAELMAPGVFLAFIGAAAVITGIFTWMFDLGLTFQLALFALYTAVAVYIGKKIYAQPVIDESDGTLNERAIQLVGKKVTALGTFDHGEGRVRLGDSVWNARSDRAVVDGDRLEVTAVDGTCLIVDTPRALPPQG